MVVSPVPVSATGTFRTATEAGRSGTGQALREGLGGEPLENRPDLCGAGQGLWEGDHQSGDLFPGDGHEGDPVGVDIDAQSPVPQRRAHADGGS